MVNNTSFVAKNVPSDTKKQEKNPTVKKLVTLNKGYMTLGGK
jgi:hypothetical protein